MFNSTWVPPCEVEDTSEFTFFAELEEGSDRAAGALGLDEKGRPLGFVDNVRFNLADDDGPGCDEHFLHQNTDTIEALDHLEAGGSWLDHHWADEQDLDDADHHHYLRYTLSHIAS